MGMGVDFSRPGVGDFCCEDCCSYSLDFDRCVKLGIDFPVVLPGGVENEACDMVCPIFSRRGRG